MRRRENIPILEQPEFLQAPHAKDAIKMFLDTALSRGYDKFIFRMNGVNITIETKLADENSMYQKYMRAMSKK